MKLLLENGAEVNVVGRSYENALHAAPSRGNEAIVKLLLENVAEVYSEGRFYENALQAAWECHGFGFITDSDVRAVVEGLLELNESELKESDNGIDIVWDRVD